MFGLLIYWQVFSTILIILAFGCCNTNRPEEKIHIYLCTSLNSMSQYFQYSQQNMKKIFDPHLVHLKWKKKSLDIDAIEKKVLIIHFYDWIITNISFVICGNKHFPSWKHAHLFCLGLSWCYISAILTRHVVAVHIFYIDGQLRNIDGNMESWISFHSFSFKLSIDKRKGFFLYKTKHFMLQVLVYYWSSMKLCWVV